MESNGALIQTATNQQKKKKKNAKKTERKMNKQEKKKKKHQSKIFSHPIVTENKLQNIVYIIFLR